MLYTTIVLSVVLSFLSSEFLGLLTGGMVSAGYLSYYLQSPTRVVSTLILAVAITLLVKLLARFVLLFGRRRFMASVLLSLLFVALLEKVYYLSSSVPMDLRVIGYIIPGLIANDMEKQGILKTLLAVLGSAMVIRLLLILGV